MKRLLITILAAMIAAGVMASCGNETQSSASAGSDAASAPQETVIVNQAPTEPADDSVDIYDYLGTDISAFVLMDSELQSGGASDGSIEYWKTGMIVSTEPNRTDISYAMLKADAGYSIKGVKIGMDLYEALNKIASAVTATKEDTDVRKVYTLDGAYQLEISVENGAVSCIIVSEEHQ